MATNVINIRRFVDVSTAVASAGTDVRRDWGAYLFVQKGSDGQTTEVKKYADLAEVIEAGSNTEAAKAAQVFYGTSYNGVAPTSPFFVATIGCKDVDEFTTNFTALMADESYYLCGLDSNLDDDIRKAACSIVEGTKNNSTHKLIVEDYSADAANKSLEDDTASLSAYTAKNKFTSVQVVYVNPTNENKYYGAAVASFWATRRFDASSRQMCSIAHKVAQGIQPIDLTDSSITVTPTQAFDNLDSKNVNAYINVKLVGLPAWERGNTPSGDDMSAFISADYVNYAITMNVFNLLQTTPRIPMNNDGASLIASSISSAFSQLYAAGVISGGVSVDGEVFPATGYKLSIPTPTGLAKATGLWENIYCVALLAGSCKRVVIANTLKQ